MRWARRSEKTQDRTTKANYAKKDYTRVSGDFFFSSSDSASDGGSRGLEGACFDLLRNAGPNLAQYMSATAWVPASEQDSLDQDERDRNHG